MSSTILPTIPNAFEHLVLSSHSARALLEIEFDQYARDRIKELLARNSEGTLSTAEREEMEGYARLNSAVSLLQSIARIQLKRTDPT